MEPENTPQPPTPSPETFFQPSVASTPPPAPVTPITPVVSPTPGQNQPGKPGAKAKGANKLFLLAAGGAVLLLIIIVVVVTLSGGKKPTTGNSSNPGNQQQGPVAATSLGIQQSNDSISQYLNSLNDQTDFPSSALSDQTLQLN